MAARSLIRRPEGDADFELAKPCRPDAVVAVLIVAGLAAGFATVLGWVPGPAFATPDQATGRALLVWLAFLIPIALYLIVVRTTGRETVTIRAGTFVLRSFLLGKRVRERCVPIESVSGLAFIRYEEAPALSTRKAILVAILVSPLEALSGTRRKYGGYLALQHGKKTIRFGHGLGEIEGPALAGSIRKKLAEQGARDL